jgi:hypothetical protein
MTYGHGPVYGSPKAGDDISKLEEGINASIDRVSRHFESVVDRIAPRAIGSQKVSPDDEIREYLLTVADTGDPAGALDSIIQEWAGQYGLPKALEMGMDYVLRNERRLVELAG